MDDTKNANETCQSSSEKDRFFQYFRSKTGKLLAISFVLNLLTLIFLITLYAGDGHWDFLLSMVIFTFVYQILLTLVFTKGWNNTVTEINWPFSIMIQTGIESLSLLIPNLLWIYEWRDWSVNLARLCSLAECAVLGYKARVDCQEWKAGRQQGQTGGCISVC